MRLAGGFKSKHEFLEWRDVEGTRNATEILKGPVGAFATPEQDDRKFTATLDGTKPMIAKNRPGITGSPAVGAFSVVALSGKGGAGLCPAAPAVTWFRLSVH
jgi:hypothetical protein